jgi:hypothetical protein
MATIIAALLKIAGKLFNKSLIIIGNTHKAVELTGLGLPASCGLITCNLIGHSLLPPGFSFFILSIPRKISSIP